MQATVFFLATTGTFKSLNFLILQTLASTIPHTLLGILLGPWYLFHHVLKYPEYINMKMLVTKFLICWRKNSSRHVCCTHGYCHLCCTYLGNEEPGVINLGQPASWPNHHPHCFTHIFIHSHTDLFMCVLITFTCPLSHCLYETVFSVNSHNAVVHLLLSLPRQ